MYRLVTSLLRFTNVYNPHQALGARTAAPRIENCRTGATMVVGAAMLLAKSLVRRHPYSQIKYFVSTSFLLFGMLVMHK